MLTTVATGYKLLLMLQFDQLEFFSHKNVTLSGLESRGLLASSFISLPTPSQANCVVLVCIVSAVSNPQIKSYIYILDKGLED